MSKIGGKFLSPNSWNFMLKLLTVELSLDKYLFNQFEQVVMSHQIEKSLTLII